jgi:hypothetical protein
MIVASIQWAERIMRTMDNMCSGENAKGETKVAAEKANGMGKDR